MQQSKRPVNLNLTKFHFPVMAIISILHRISGVVLFFLSPYMLWLLQESLRSESSFQNLQEHLQRGCCKFLIWVLLSALTYHSVAGIRHLVMDMGWGESLKWGRIGSYIVLVVSIILIILAGIWVWR